MMDVKVSGELISKTAELWIGKSSQSVTEAMAVLSAYLIDNYPEEYKEDKMNQYFQKIEYILKNHKPKAFFDSHGMK